MHPHIHAQRTPDKPAVIMGSSGAVVTYRELDERSNQVAHLFRSQGLQPGDRVAFMVENHPRLFELCWGAQRSGKRPFKPRRRLHLIQRPLPPASTFHGTLESGRFAVQRGKSGPRGRQRCFRC